MKRMISLMLAFCMIWSVLPAVSVSASAAPMDGNPYLLLPTLDHPGENSWAMDIGSMFGYGSGEKPNVLMAEENAPTGMALTALTVGQVDALTTPSGDGWSFDAETATLTLSGASISNSDGSGDGIGINAVGDLTIVLEENTENTITATDIGIKVEGALTIRGGTLHVNATEKYSMAIYTIDDISIMDCVELTVVGGANGIISEGGVTISDSKVLADFRCKIIEAMEAGTYASPAAIISILDISIQGSEVTAKGNGYGISVNNSSLMITDSTVDVDADYLGIAVMYDCEIRNSTVTLKSNASVEEFLELKQAAGIGLMAQRNLYLSESDVDLEGTSVGIVANGMDVVDSVVSSTSGYMGVAAYNGLRMSSSELSTELTFTLEETNAYMNSFQLSDPPAGVVTYKNAEIIECTLSVSAFSGSMYGIYSGEAITLDSSDIMIRNILMSGIACNTTLTIRNCENVVAQGGYAGLLCSSDLVITNSNIQADATWTDEEIQMYGVPGAFAMIVGTSYNITGVISGGEPGRYEDDEGNICYTVMDENGVPVRSVTITAADSPVYTTPTEPDDPEPSEPEIIASGTCGENVIWTLNAEWDLIISGEGPMNDYATNRPAPWYSTYRNRIKTVTIENGVTSIGKSAFYGCSILTTITIGNSVTSVDLSTISNCGALTAIYVDADNPNYSNDEFGVLYDKEKSVLYRMPRAFSGAYTIPDSVAAVADSAFSRCANVTEMIIADSVSTIGNGAFYSCSSLADVEIGNSVTAIGKNAFAYCDSLITVNIPSSVTTIGEGAFRCCIKLTGIYVDDDNQNYSDIAGVLFTKDQTVLMQVPFRTQGYYTIPDGVITIANYALEDCDRITGIMIPNSVVSVGDYAFAYCDRLEEVAIGNGVTSIGSYAFSYCNSLISVVIPDSVIAIKDNSFRECDHLASVTVGSGVASVGTQAFAYCDTLTEIEFLGNAPKFLTGVFDGLTAKVYYPSEDSTWTEDVMQNYGGTITWVPYNAVTEPETIASGYSGSTTWVLTSDGVMTFSGTGNMKNYGFGRNQPWLDYADQITSIVVEEGVTAIGTGAFMDLTRLESVTLPETGLTKIGEAAFYGCSSLKDIYIPDGIYTIWEYTFKNCTSLESVRLPRTLEKIDQGAFENCTGLETMFLPGNVNIIGAWSFKGCTGLKEVDMQWTDATEIRAGAFKNCSALTEIILPANIQKLGDSCFYGIGATSFTVPTTVTVIEPWCFARAALKEIIFMGDAPAIGEGAFNKITATAFYPDGNATWTSDVMQNYGGTITWEAN